LQEGVIIESSSASRAIQSTLLAYLEQLGIAVLELVELVVIVTIHDDLLGHGIESLIRVVGCAVQLLLHCHMMKVLLLQLHLL
jgi:hypothetical protein